jgi:hypothetical protein
VRLLGRSPEPVAQQVYVGVPWIIQDYDPAWLLRLVLLLELGAEAVKLDHLQHGHQGKRMELPWRLAPFDVEQCLDALDISRASAERKRVRDYDQEPD